MLKNLLISFFLFSLFSHLCFSQKASDDIRLRSIISEKGQAEVKIPNPGPTETDRITRIFSISTATGKNLHIFLSPLTVEQFISEKIDYQIITRDESKGITTAATLAEAMEWESYPTYSQYDSIMRHFAAAYPSLCRLDTIGTSIKGKLILALKISDNCTIDESEPESFYTSSIHGNETAGFILMLRLADYLLTNYNTSERIKKLVDNIEIWINPLANPDGTYKDGNVIISPVRNNANGYDLNRNFPDPLISGSVIQKETTEMMIFLESHMFTLSANFHSGSEVVNYPWDRWSNPHADNEWFYLISREWADTVHKYSRKGYMDFLDNGVTNGYDWYPVYGGRQDYVTYSLYGREVTVELDTNYVTPVGDLADLWEYNRRSILGYLENLFYGIQGVVLDATDDKPVKSMIFIEGHDMDNSHIFSDSLTGVFTRLIVPGLYDLKFAADGYRDTIIKNVQVFTLEATNLTVKMRSSINPVDTTDPGQPFFYPNPGDTFIKTVLPEKMKGMVNIRIFTMDGRKIADYDDDTQEEYPVQLDVSRFPAGTYFVVFKSILSDSSCSGRIIVVRRF